MFDHMYVYGLMRKGFDIEPAISLLDVPDNIEVLHVTKNTLALDRLPTLANLRHLCAHDINDAKFNQLCEASQVTHFSVNAYGITDVQKLGNLVNLQGLELSDNTKISTLNGLEKLTALQVFALAASPVSIDLAPLSACTELRNLWLSSSQAKPMRINSLLPLSTVTKLERLKLANVRVADCKLGALHNLTMLAELDLPNFFPIEEFIALRLALPHAKGHWLNKYLVGH
ncbi:hypothetical protein ACO0LG_01160 [Undibacterium sp. Ji42W]|uniref:hypothetical protein n=1 Tax=Undibacterium sp. Ji42W TaxID=3413039 RepID=UPI003BEFA312